MKTTLWTAVLGLGLGLGLTGVATAQVDPAPTAEPKQEAKQLYNEQADAKADIEAALAKAKKENRRVLIQWGANWCGWCHKLDETFTKDRTVARTLMYEYDVVHVDIGRFDKNTDLAEKYKADLKQGVPFLTILAADGTVVTNQETGSLEEGAKHDPAKVDGFLQKHKAEYKKAEDILQAGLSTAARENKIAFLHFGAPWCGWCHKLEDWMARKDISAVLSKQFVDIKIDTDRTIGGKEVLEKYTKGESTGIPWFAFLDPKGEVLVTSMGPKGNVGFPYEPFEIDWFKQMLTKSAKNLSAEEIDTVIGTMGKEKTR